MRTMAESGEAPDPRLVEEVKNLCRADMRTKVEWCAWCDIHVNGTKDPNRLSAENLDSFLTDYNAGVTWADASAHRLAGGGGPPLGANGAPPSGKAQPDLQELAEAVKLGQRVSPSWKAAWASYAQAYGNGMYDPSKHTKDFLISYLEFLGQGSSGGSVGGWATSARPAQGPAKRPRLEDLSALPAMMGSQRRPLSGGFGVVQDKIQSILSDMSRGGSEDPSVSTMAERVRELQKNDQVMKQQWSDFCDERASGTKDPRRHSRDTLEEFLQLYDSSF